MDIDKILSFCTVVDCGSLSKASAILYCSQPALSKKIVALEKSIGYPLFERNNKKMTVNENGQLLYAFGRQLEQNLNQLKADLYTLNHPHRREVSFGATNYIGTYLVPPILSRFKKQYPDIPVNFTVNFFPDIMEMLSQDVLSFALIPENDELLYNSDYICEPFFEDEMAVVFQPHHPLAAKEQIEPSELLAYPFLISQHQSATRNFILSRLSAHNIQLTNISNMYNTETIKQSIISGMGISILSKTSVANRVRHHLLKAVPLNGVNLTRKLYLIHKKNRVLSQEDAFFIQSVLEKYWH
ncbi:MAG: LysR family transcriptional regulator [Cellulosilyticum sp.]|nr:LysR family transcriptional regulator [Cellulosilyticum sp.]